MLGEISVRVFSSEARRVASSHDCKYVEVSAGLNHNVDTLLVTTFFYLLLVFLCVLIELLPGGHCQANPTESSGRDETGSQSLGKQVKFEGEI